MRRYFIWSAILLSGGLITSGLLEMYFRYREGREQLSLLQQEVADGAAFKVSEFIRGIGRGMRATTKTRDIASSGLSPQYKYDLERLLFIVSPISELVAIDIEGKTRAQAARFRSILSDNSDGFADSAAFQTAKEGKTYFSPVYFVRGSEPFMTIAVPIERYAGDVIGVLQAEVNLKYIWEVISAIKVGTAGLAYIVNRSGDLIAHPDISLVLGRRNLAGLGHVKAAFQAVSTVPDARAVVTHDLQGQKVFSSRALIPNLDWAVFVERPAEEADAPLYASMLRTSSLLLVGLGMALLASLFVARRVVRPLGILRQGVERIGRGDLDVSLEPRTGDEFDILADEFNKMTGALKEAYTGLEQKIEERTHDLAIANQRLQELDNLKSEFVSNVSHELRTPLTSIKGSVDNMLDGLTGPLNEKQVRYLNRVKASGDRLSRLINDLLDLSSIEEGKIKLSPINLTLAPLIHDVVDSLRPMAAEKAIDLTVTNPDSHETVWADRDKVTQVLLNLTGNAIKFTPPHGNVNLAVKHNGNGLVQVSVKDTGPGIPPDEAKKIFDKFYQITPASEKKTKGSGLGLAISRSLLEMQGGRIWVENNGSGGSTFHFTLPTRETADIESLPNI